MAPVFVGIDVSQATLDLAVRPTGDTWQVPNDPARMPDLVANPRQVHDFGKATGQLAKTDWIDAGLLALFAERVRPEPRPLPDAATEALSALLTRRRQLLEMLTAERNRLGFREHRRSGVASSSTSGGWNASWPGSTATWAAPSKPVPSGRPPRICSAVCPGSDRW